MIKAMGQIIILLVINIITLNAFAAPPPVRDLKRIYPLKECMEFHLAYYKQGNEYFISYPVTVDGVEAYKEPFIKIKSITNLSEIADLISVESQKKCTKAVQITTSDNSCTTLEGLDPEFIKIIQQAADAVGKDDRDCNDVANYLELRTKIVNLNPKNPVEIKNASDFGNKFLKIFVDKESGKKIDLFEMCGGEDHSDVFLQNFMLIEASNKCIMPKPPGMLSWKEMRAIAGSVAANYKKKSISHFKDKADEITKKLTFEVTKKVAMNSI
jgi:hypothetical protein